LFVSSIAVTFVSALCIIPVSIFEHKRSPRPSILLNIYLFLTLLFDVVQTRTLWLASVNFNDNIFSRLFTASIAVKALLIVLESQNKSKWIQWDAEKHSPEETSGIFGLGAFFWLNRLFWAGSRRILTLGDLFPLDRSMTAESLQLELISHMESGQKGQKYGLGLAKAMARTLAAPLVLPIAPRVALTAFKFCQPFLIHSLLDYLQKPADKSSKNIGYGLIGATVLVYIGIAISNALYWYFHERTLCMTRGALAGAIYRKATEVPLSAAGDSEALTLMSADVERIRLGLMNLHDYWGNTIEVALASWLLERQLGVAFVAPLVLILCCTIAASFVHRYTGQRQKLWMSKIQKRVGLTANVISNMKHLKISGLAVPVEKLIQSMRVDELESSSSFRRIYVAVITIGYTPLALSPVVTFAVTGRTLDVCNTCFVNH
jgi:ATP-binding cassette subfamily C (CFTR/MRP) protein 1